TPDRSQWTPERAPGDDAAALLVVEVPGVVDRGEGLPASARRGKEGGVEADEEHVALWKSARAPVLPAQVAAEHRRQPAGGSVVLDRGRLAVVVGDDGTIRAFARCERPPRGHRLTRELRPSELVLVEAVLPDAALDHRARAAHGYDERQGDGEHA